MIIDKYVYPGTNVLKNKKNITHFQALSGAERTCSSLNIIRLRQLGITGRFDISHLQSIHRELFSDIYEWAGEFRNIEIYQKFDKNTLTPMSSGMNCHIKSCYFVVFFCMNA